MTRSKTASGTLPFEAIALSIRAPVPCCCFWISSSASTSVVSIWPSSSLMSLQPESRLDQPEAHLVAVGDALGLAGLEGLAVDEGAVADASLLDHEELIATADDLGVAARERALRVEGGEHDVGHVALDGVGAAHNCLTARRQRELVAVCVDETRTPGLGCGRAGGRSLRKRLGLDR